ncbi:MAG TPA: serpin family protein [Candidatus Angelobacter sp.]|nr:serpin family protein [Candidatus Angelobacter sp.]
MKQVLAAFLLAALLSTQAVTQSTRSPASLDSNRRDSNGHDSNGRASGGHKQSQQDLYAPRPKPETYRDVVAANNRFAIDFFKATFEETPDKNILTAPASLSYAFGLLMNGARGTGRDQIAAAFHLADIPPEQINQGNAVLWSIRQSHEVKQSDLQPSSVKHPHAEFLGEIGADGRTFQPYIMASAMWVPNHLFTPSFQAINSGVYKLRHFSQFPTASAINEWSSQVTHGKITAIVDDVSKEDFILATVTYFNSRWADPFSPGKTHDGDFTLLSGEKKRVPLMVQAREFEYLRGDSFQAVTLHLHDAAMMIFLPDEDSSLQAFVASLTPDKWSEWTRQFARKEGHLELPRFEVNQERDTKSVLKKMGLTSLFSDYSTFVPMVGARGAVLTRLQEGASMKVDEVGAEVTSYGVVGGVIGGVCGNCPQPEPFKMIMNRPFFVAVIDTRTNETLYLGGIVEP